MAHDAKYGEVTVENEPGNPLGEDEPVFLLRARDITSVSMLEHYKHMAFVMNSPEEHINSMDYVIKAFKDWQRAHTELVKIPD